MATSPVLITIIVLTILALLAGIWYAMRHNLQDKRKMPDLEAAYRNRNHHLRHEGQAMRYPNHERHVSHVYQ